MNDCSRKELEDAYYRLLNERNNILLELKRFQAYCHEGTATELQMLVSENNALRKALDYYEHRDIPNTR